MPARRRKQSNAMLYTLITFVGLFIASTTVAVIYYVKAEEHRTSLEEKERTISEFASEREQQATGAIVGANSGRTWLGTMVGHLNHTVSLILGGVPEESISAEVKVDNADTEVLSTLNMAKEYLDIPEPNLTDPNIIGLVPVVKQLANELKNIIDANNVTSGNLAKLQDDFDNANKAHLDAEQKLTAEKEALQQSVEQTKQKYAELETLLQQTTDEKVQTLQASLQQMKNERDALNDTLLLTQAELAQARGRLQLAQEEVNKIMPGPDPNVLALEPDAKIISIDDQTQVVHLDKGSDDRIYQGLTFTVYDRGSA
ncbi:MAG: hypothetical protein JXM79_23605, partial [Sedimentisphaerales bacterium]|nr:hypothetical protein [Sedimentisphaerales bacterium]